MLLCVYEFKGSVKFNEEEKEAKKFGKRDF